MKLPFSKKETSQCYGPTPTTLLSLPLMAAPRLLPLRFCLMNFSKLQENSAMRLLPLYHATLSTEFTMPMVIDSIIMGTMHSYWRRYVNETLRMRMDTNGLFVAPK